MPSPKSKDYFIFLYEDQQLRNMMLAYKLSVIAYKSIEIKICAGEVISYDLATDNQSLILCNGSPANIEIDEESIHTFRICYLMQGYYEAFMHVIDPVTKQIEERYIINTTCQPPLITKIENVNCMYGKETTALIPYVNQYSETKKIVFVSSDSDVMEIESHEEIYPPQHEKPIQLLVQPISENRVTYIFAYDAFRKIIGTIQINLLVK